jgi:hypothetical protein
MSQHTLDTQAIRKYEKRVTTEFSIGVVVVIAICVALAVAATECYRWLEDANLDLLPQIGCFAGICLGGVLAFFLALTAYAVPATRRTKRYADKTVGPVLDRLAGESGVQFDWMTFSTEMFAQSQDQRWSPIIAVSDGQRREFQLLFDGDRVNISRIETAAPQQG